MSHALLFYILYLLLFVVCIVCVSYWSSYEAKAVCFVWLTQFLQRCCVSWMRNTTEKESCSGPILDRNRHKIEKKSRDIALCNGNVFMNEMIRFAIEKMEIYVKLLHFVWKLPLMLWCYGKTCMYNLMWKNVFFCCFELDD